MGFLIYSLELLKGGMGVDFCGREALMTQQFLHTFQTSLVIEHCGSEGMAEHMGRPFAERGYKRQTSLHLVSYLVTTHPLSLASHKQGAVTGLDLLITHPYIY